MLVSPFDLERAEILTRIAQIQDDLVETNHLMTEFKARWVEPGLALRAANPGQIFILTKILDQATRFSMKYLELKTAYIEEMEKTKELDAREIIHEELKKFQI